MHNKILAMVVLLSLSPLAWGHKIILDVFVSGDVVEGELGFSNGEMASHADLSVLNQMGQELAQLQTDADGFFTYLPTQQQDLVFYADLGAGHIAKVDLPAAELNLSTLTTLKEPESSNLVKTNLASLSAQPANAALELQKLKDEIRSMRRDLKAYKEQRDWQSILGGLGYILGLVGLAYYFAAQRKLRDK